MDDATLKTIENAVVICAEHSKNSANNATTATNARQQAEKLVAGIGETEKNVAKQAQRAEEAVESTETAQKAVANYVDVVFPAKVNVVEKRLANITAEGVKAVTDKATQSVNSITAHTTTIVGALDTKKTAIETSIDSKAQAVNSALDTKVTEANTAIDGKVAGANQAKTDAETAKTQAVTAKGQAEGFASQASTSASNASKSAKQAEDAKTAIGDVGGRLDKVDDRLSQIPISQSITYRDVMGELQKAKGWTDSVAYNYVIKRIVTTKNGNLVLLAQSVNTAFAIYILSTEGEVLASQSLPKNLAFYLNTNTYLLEYNEEIIVLTDATCYKVVDTATSAMISAIGTIDFNGLATRLPERPSATEVLTIGDRAILAGMVIDLTNLKVIQSLSAYPIFVYGYTHSEADTAIVTLSNGNVAYLTIGEDGLISVTDDKVHKNAYFVTKNSSSDVHGWIKPLGTGFCDFLTMRKNMSDLFASVKCLEFLKGRIVSSGKKLCGLTNDGRIAVVKTSVGTAVNGTSPIYHFAECEMNSFYSSYRIIGVDPRGVWFLSKAVYVWAGYHPTGALVRVNF